MALTFESSASLSPQVALRPEPFGALAYHYGNRRLVFLKHPDVVTVVRDVANHASLRDALSINGIDESRWQSFVVALDSLAKSDVIRVH